MRGSLIFRILFHQQQQLPLFQSLLSPGTADGTLSDSDQAMRQDSGTSEAFAAPASGRTLGGGSGTASRRPHVDPRAARLKALEAKKGQQS